jgi:hypothetical protein
MQRLNEASSPFEFFPSSQKMSDEIFLQILVPAEVGGGDREFDATKDASVGSERRPQNVEPRPQLGHPNTAKQRGGEPCTFE